MGHPQTPIVSSDLTLWIKRRYPNTPQTKCLIVVTETEQHRGQRPHGNRRADIEIVPAEESGKWTQAKVKPIHVCMMPGPFRVPIKPPLTAIPISNRHYQ